MTQIFSVLIKLLKKSTKKVNLDLKRLVEWLLANKISLNKTKTELIFFRKPRDQVPQNYNFKLNGLKLTHSNHIKYLGIYLDETLSGAYQCSILAGKLSRAVAMLSKVRHYVPEHELISVYHAIFSSHMTHGCQIWGQNS